MQDSHNTLVACEQGEVSAEESKSALSQLCAYLRNKLPNYPQPFFVVLFQR